MEYVNVANIIEQERKKRQAQIFKGVDTNIIDHIEKAHETEFQKGYTEELPENLQRFSSDIESFNKAETEFLLSKIQGELNANFNNPLLKSMKTIALNHLNTEIEKAKSGVYADNAENRKLGRVGQKYGNEKKEKPLNSFERWRKTYEEKYQKKTPLLDENKYLNHKHPAIIELGNISRKEGVNAKNNKRYQEISQEIERQKKVWDDNKDAMVIDAHWGGDADAYYKHKEDIKQKRRETLSKRYANSSKR